MAGKRGKTDKFVHFNRLVDHVARHLTESELRLWILLWRKSNWERRCYVPTSRLAAQMGVSRATAYKALNSLKSLCLVALTTHPYYSQRSITQVQCPERYEQELHPLLVERCERRAQKKSRIRAARWGEVPAQ